MSTNSVNWVVVVNKLSEIDRFGEVEDVVNEVKDINEVNKVNQSKVGEVNNVDNVGEVDEVDKVDEVGKYFHQTASCPSTSSSTRTPARLKRLALRGPGRRLKTLAVVVAVVKRWAAVACVSFFSLALRVSLAGWRGLKIWMYTLQFIV